MPYFAQFNKPHLFREVNLTKKSKIELATNAFVIGRFKNTGYRRPIAFSYWFVLGTNYPTDICLQSFILKNCSIKLTVHTPPTSIRRAKKNYDTSNQYYFMRVHCKHQEPSSLCESKITEYSYFFWIGYLLLMRKLSFAPPVSTSFGFVTQCLFLSCVMHSLCFLLFFIPCLCILRCE